MFPLLVYQNQEIITCNLFSLMLIASMLHQTLDLTDVLSEQMLPIFVFVSGKQYILSMFQALLTHLYLCLHLTTCPLQIKHIHFFSISHSYDTNRQNFDLAALQNQICYEFEQSIPFFFFHQMQQLVLQENKQEIQPKYLTENPYFK